VLSVRRSSRGEAEVKHFTFNIYSIQIPPNEYEKGYFILPGRFNGLFYFLFDYKENRIHHTAG
jgi:hypothetical protein